MGEKLSPCRNNLSRYTSWDLVPLGMKWACTCAGKGNVFHSLRRVRRWSTVCGVAGLVVVAAFRDCHSLFSRSSVCLSQKYTSSCTCSIHRCLSCTGPEIPRCFKSPLKPSLQETDGGEATKELHHKLKDVCVCRASVSYNEMQEADSINLCLPSRLHEKHRCRELGYQGCLQHGQQT